MSTVKTNNLQIGQSVTATNNGTWYQPSTPDGTIRYGIGNAGATTSDVITLTSAGNVGIGTSSPAQTLHVKTATGGTPITLGVLSNATGLPALSFNGAYASTTMAGIYGNGASASNLYYTVPASQNHYFAIADSTKMTLDSSGNLGLGVTPSAGPTSSWRVFNIGNAGGTIRSDGSSVYMDVAQNLTGNGLYAISAAATQYRQTIGQHIWYTAPSGTAGNAISFTQAMTLGSSGSLTVPYIYNTTGAGSGTVVVGTDGLLFRSSSSARYKKDIVDARYGLTDLLNLRPVNYVGAGDGDTDKVLGGLIAEEVDAAGLHEFVIYDDEDRPDALHYANMVSLCIKAIQELSAELNELKAKVNA